MILFKEVHMKINGVEVDCTRPKCYTPNDGIYPLCKGNESPEHNCKECCLYEDMEEPERSY